jgi:hypothetical protein
MSNEADSLATMLVHDRPDLQKILVETHGDLKVCAEEMILFATEDYSKPCADDFQDQAKELTSRLPFTYLSAPLAHLNSYLEVFNAPPEPLNSYPEDHNDLPSLEECDSSDDEPDECEFAVYPPMTNTVPNQPRKVHHDEMVSFKVDQNCTRREVAQRVDDILTPQ